MITRQTSAITETARPGRTISPHRSPDASNAMSRATAEIGTKPAGATASGTDAAAIGDRSERPIGHSPVRSHASRISLSGISMPECRNQIVAGSARSGR